MSPARRPPKLSGKPVLLVGLFSAKVRDPAARMTELRNALTACGARVVAEVIQRREAPREGRAGALRRPEAPTRPPLDLEPGKAEELARLCKDTGAEALVFNDYLAPVLRAQLEEQMGYEILDRAVIDAFTPR